MEYHTNKGQLGEKQLMNILMWGSYKANRDDGVSHEALVKWNIGDEEMKRRYDLEGRGIYEN